MASMAAAAMIRVSRVMRLDLLRLLDMGAHVLSRIAAALRCRRIRARRKPRRLALFRLAARTNGAPSFRHRARKIAMRAPLPPDCASARRLGATRRGWPHRCAALLANDAGGHYGPTMVQEKVHKLATLWSHFSRSR